MAKKQKTFPSCFVQFLVLFYNTFGLTVIPGIPCTFSDGKTKRNCIGICVRRIRWCADEFHFVLYSRRFSFLSMESCKFSISYNCIVVCRRCAVVACLYVCTLVPGGPSYTVLFTGFHSNGAVGAEALLYVCPHCAQANGCNDIKVFRNDGDTRYQLNLNGCFVFTDDGLT